MLALTLKHPWVYAITDLGKRIENRTWRPPCKAIMQTIALHGGVAPKGNGAAFREAADDLSALMDRGLAPRGLELEDVVLPGIVGTFWVSHFIEEGQGDPLEEDPWFEGPYGWVLRGVIKFREPIPCLGAQGLWTVPEHLLPLIERRSEEARQPA